MFLGQCSFYELRESLDCLLSVPEAVQKEGTAILDALKNVILAKV